MFFNKNDIKFNKNQKSFTVKVKDKSIASFIDLITNNDITVKGSTITVPVNDKTMSAEDVMDLFLAAKLIK